MQVPLPKRALFFRRLNRNGVALVLVLAFVVLLASIIVAFFSRAQAEQQISRASSSQTKVKLLADGAVDTIVGDLKAEMATNSVVVTTNGATIYEVTNPATMVPERTDGALADTNATNYANLISYSGTALYTNGPDRGASGEKTTATNAVGRSISTDRWSKPLFVPDAGKNIFDKVKWITVTRKGDNGSTAATGQGGLSDADKVIGRYAYVIYDEGGLLDLNVAGYPSASSGASWDAAMDPVSKSTAAYADLTQIPGVTQANVDDLVNWRNAASLTSPGYRKYVEANKSGFLHTGNTQLAAGVNTDHMFVSRQQMISFLTGNLKWAPDTLRYFTNFSRDSNQPSLSPKHAGTGSLPTLKSRAQGGNNLTQADYDKVNPSFLKQIVTNSIQRNNGSYAAPGEPLIKQRFALSRLIWLTYLGPSQGQGGTDIQDLKNNLGVTQEWLDQGTLENIRKYFGLEWEAANNCWRYNSHLSSSGTIKTLDEVAVDQREPDFFEILKASITAGALGKSSTTLTTPASSATDYNVPEKYQYTRDSSVDYQVMQIGANIIDQSDVDGYPTRIRYGSDSLDNIEFRGVENLPYLYRVRTSVYRTRDPDITNPQPARNAATATDKGEFIAVQQPELWNPHDYDATSSATRDRSMGNPRPTNFEIVAFSGKANLASAPHLEPIVITPLVTPYYNGPLVFGPAGSPSLLSEDQSKLTFSNGPMLFREPTLLIKKGVPTGSNLAPGPSSTIKGSGDGTLVKDSPPMSYLNAANTSIEPGTTPGLYLGVRLGKADLAWTAGTTNYVANGVEIEINDGITYQVRCQNPSGIGMETYDEKYFRPSLYTARLPTGSISLYDNTAGGDRYRGIGIISNQVASACVDPRTSRFGLVDDDLQGNWFQWTEFQPYSRNGDAQYFSNRWINVADNTLNTLRPDTNAGWGYSLSGPIEDPSTIWTDWKTAYPPLRTSGANKGWWWGSNSQWSRYASFRMGLLSQNVMTLGDNKFNATPFVLSDYYNKDETPESNQTYYSDCDGVVRRASGGYAMAATSPSGLIGLPMATAFPSATASPTSRQRESRPMILNRPFRSVGELGYVFSDTPWKNLDFSTVESGFSPLLDAFCINDSDNADGLVAGKVNLNTRQKCILMAILSQAYRNASATTAAALQSLTDANAKILAEKLLARTTSTVPSKGPLMNPSELVGRWVGSATGVMGINGSAVTSYDGFANDLDSVAGDDYQKYIARYRETAVRALAANGTTRTWNLMVDLIAQNGHYLPGKSDAASFVVEGELHRWVHLAIDRFTGKVLDKQEELVKE
jgi:hypothetical protein